MTKFALYVPLEAKPGKEKEVANFLRSAVPLVNAEVGTISWFAIQEGPSSFAIFDTFDDEAGRDAHLNGKVAAALMEKAKAGDLFAKTPEIHKLGILADKLPNKSLPARPVAMSFDAAGCSRLFNARIASRMTANGTPRRFAAVPNFGSDRSEADMPRASGACRSDENDQHLSGRWYRCRHLPQRHDFRTADVQELYG